MFLKVNSKFLTIRKAAITTIQRSITAVVNVICIYKLHLSYSVFTSFMSTFKHISSWLTLRAICDNTQFLNALRRVFHVCHYFYLHQTIAVYRLWSYKEERFIWILKCFKSGQTIGLWNKSLISIVGVTKVF
jgi:hypothetical protein